MATTAIPGALRDAIVNLAPSEVCLDDLKTTEFQGIDPSVIRLLAQADDLVRRGIGYRPYRFSRPLSRKDLTPLKRRLSCSEFLWSLFSLADFDMGDHPVKSKKMAFKKNVYPQTLMKVTDGSILPGDILVYAHPREELKRQRERFGKSEVGHVVLVVSADRKIVVGSHGRESTPSGGKIGVGYRKLLQGWEWWTNGRPLQAVYRLSSLYKRGEHDR